MSCVFVKWFDLNLSTLFLIETLYTEDHLLKYLIIQILFIVQSYWQELWSLADDSSFQSFQLKKNVGLILNWFLKVFFLVSLWTLMTFSFAFWFIEISLKISSNLWMSYTQLKFIELIIYKFISEIVEQNL